MLKISPKLGTNKVAALTLRNIYEYITGGIFFLRFINTAFSAVYVRQGGIQKLLVSCVI